MVMYSTVVVAGQPNTQFPLKQPICNNLSFLFAGVCLSRSDVFVVFGLSALKADLASITALFFAAS